MRRLTRLVLLVAVPLAVLSAGVAALHGWVNSDGFRDRLGAEATWAGHHAIAQHLSH